jgi:hypothetical protein
LSRLCIYRKWLAQCFNIDLLRGWRGLEKSRQRK